LTGDKSTDREQRGPAHMDTLTERIEEILARLRAIETGLQHLREEQTAKEWYGTAEIASLLGRSEYTVREWCRKRQIPAEKTANGRDWIVSHETLLRLKNRELPLPEHEVNGVTQRRRA
jgi:excisionase family DNA binding protein